MSINSVTQNGFQKKFYEKDNLEIPIPYQRIIELEEILRGFMPGLLRVYSKPLRPRDFIKHLTRRIWSKNSFKN